MKPKFNKEQYEKVKKHLLNDENWADRKMIDIAEELYPLERIRVNNKYGGSAEGTYPALTGFSTFDEAEQIAKEFDLKICQFVIKPGWHSYYNDGVMFNPIDIENFEFPDDFIKLYLDDKDDFFDDYIKERVDSFYDLDEFNIYYHNAILLYKALDDLNDDDFVLYDNSLLMNYDGTKEESGEGWLYDFYPKKAMDFYSNFDGVKYIIGVIE